MFENRFILNKSIKNFADIEDKTNMIVGSHGPKTNTEIKEEKIVVSILNKIKYDLLDHYLHPYTIAKMYKKFECDTLDSILNNYSNKGGGPIVKIIDRNH